MGYWMGGLCTLGGVVTLIGELKGHNTQQSGHTGPNLST